MGRFPKPLSSLYPQETSHYYEVKTRLTEEKIATPIYGKFSLMALEFQKDLFTDGLMISKN